MSVSRNRTKSTNPAKPNRKPTLEKSDGAPPSTIQPAEVTRTVSAATRATVRRVSEHSGAFEGESITDAVRRHVAWIVLALEQLDQTGDTVQADLAIAHAANALLRLSLEVNELEEHARKAVA